jgi:hypothetical protein
MCDAHADINARRCQDRRDGRKSIPVAVPAPQVSQVNV